MNRTEQAFLDFASTWEPYGGPPAGDVLVTFGLTLPAFRARVRDILADPGTAADRLRRQHARAVLQAYLNDGVGLRASSEQAPGPPRPV